MSWTLYLLIGISLATASAYNHVDSDHDSLYYNNYYENENSRLSGNANEMSYLERRGRFPANSKQIWAYDLGLTPHPEIPEHCLETGICENVINYPHELVNTFIVELGNISIFQNDEVDAPELDVTQRQGPAENNIELCNFEEVYMYPQAAKDSAGLWHLVLNQDEQKLQGFKVETCKKGDQTCSSGSNLCPCANIPGYKTQCIQKFTYRRMAVYNESKITQILRVPNCCTCVGEINEYE